MATCRQDMRTSLEVGVGAVAAACFFLCKAARVEKIVTVWMRGK